MIGYRAWQLDENDRLAALYYSQIWHAGLNMAKCRNSLAVSLGEPTCTQAPGEHCQCGFWFLPSVEDVFRYILGQGQSRPWLIGAVQTHGRHVEHEFGTRCEKAVVTELYVAEPDPTNIYLRAYADERRVRAAARICDVPVKQIWAPAPARSTFAWQIRVSTELADDSATMNGVSIVDALMFVMESPAQRSARRREWLKQGLIPTAAWYRQDDDPMEALRPPIRKRASKREEFDHDE